MAKVTKPRKTWFSIGQVNAVTGIPKSTIRFWEKEFSDFLVPLRTTGNQRRYDTRTVAILKQINQLVNEEGYTLDGAKRKLEAGENQKQKPEGIKRTELGELAETMSDLFLQQLLEKVKLEQPELVKAEN